MINREILNNKIVETIGAVYIYIYIDYFTKKQNCLLAKKHI